MAAELKKPIFWFGLAVVVIAADLSTAEIDLLRWLAFGLFHSPNGLSTAAWVNVNKAATKRHLGFFT